MNFRFLDFSEDLLKTVVKENQKAEAIFLFPSRKSAKEAWKLYQPYWNLGKQIFFTMDEWINSFYLSDTPILKEEKRTLAFYQALNQEQKEMLNISSYFQSIKTAHNFFSFWEESSYNNIEEEHIRTILNNEENATSWQLQLFNLFVQIKQDYRNYIHQLGFNDIIFLSESKADYSEAENYQIIVVNQFYFSNREKQILEKFSNHVTIYYQLPEEYLNKKKLEVSNDFSAAAITKHSNEKISLIEANSQMDMILAYLSNLDKDKSNLTVDFRSEAQSYNYFINPLILSGRINSFNQSKIYILLEKIHEILNTSTQLYTQHKILIKWDKLLKILNDKTIQEIISPNEATKWDSLLKHYHKLQDRNYLYIDLEGNFLNYQSWTSDIIELFQSVLDIIKTFTKISSLNQLTRAITSQLFLNMISLDATEDNDFSDKFLETIADFKTIEECGLKLNWKNIFSESNGGISTSCGILKLFLDYMKPKEISYRSKGSNFVNITSLHNLRNLKLAEITLLNIVEGILPPPPHAPFLLTENQRRELGLKTYDEIKLREKYYFLRTLATSKIVKIYTYSNINENIERSSFLEELILSDNFKIEKSKQIETCKISNLFRQIFNNPNPQFKPDIKKIEKETFYNIPFDLNKDIHDRTLPLTGYSSGELIKNPFKYYLKYLAGIKSRVSNLNYDLSEKLIGQIAHDAFHFIWQRLFEVYEGNKIHHNFLFTNENYAERAIEHLLSKPYFIYFLPQNYSDTYFRHFFLPILKTGIMHFFYKLHNDLQLSDKTINAFAEIKENITYQPDYLIKQNINLKLSGISDLIIKTSDKTMIFDYKTGTENNEKSNRYFQQLNFYKLILSKLEEDIPEENIKSYLYYIEEMRIKDQQWKRQTDQEIMEKYKENLKEAIIEVIEKGFTISKSKDREEMLPISRWDLYDRRKNSGNQ